jgi:hypothetical protein
MVWLESPYITQEPLAELVKEAEGKSKRNPGELDSLFGELNLDSGISKAVVALESY